VGTAAAAAKVQGPLDYWMTRVGQESPLPSVCSDSLDASYFPAVIIKINKILGLFVMI